ncbi:MAG TPA: glycosyltransferase family 2 protein [Kofleriaceae bacterium]|nr:glycosyltransferase family 2 protein [Kofleriaceae bacterium]
MYRGLTTAVVIPAFNEELAIASAIRSVPAFVDHIIVVDDASRDATARRAAATPVGRLEILRHGANRGVGAAIASGYRRALALGLDATAVMAGDGQMDPDDLPRLLDPIADGRADYAKGNRFAHPDLWRTMPAARIAGNLALSLATRWTSGYRDLFDSQCGYTAITRRALSRIDLDRLFPRYGYPNDLLARLHVVGARVVDVAVRPIYGARWKSGIRLHTVVYPIAFVLARSWMERVGAEVRAPAQLESEDNARRVGDDVVSAISG